MLNLGEKERNHEKEEGVYSDVVDSYFWLNHFEDIFGVSPMQFETVDGRPEGKTVWSKDFDRQLETYAAAGRRLEREEVKISHTEYIQQYIELADQVVYAYPSHLFSGNMYLLPRVKELRGLLRGRQEQAGNLRERVRKQNHNLSPFS